MSYNPAWHLKGPKPYDVQIEALRRSHDRTRYGFFLEQGLGKTALQLNDYIENFSEYDTAIVICPNSFKQDWTLAPAEWGVPEITGGFWPRNEFRRGTASRPHLNVVNFEAVRSSAYDHIKPIMERGPTLLIIDESSAIKNFKAKTTKAVLDLSKRTKAVRELNGTPIGNNVMDLFPQLKCLGELDKVNPYAFRNHFAVMGGWMGKQIMGVRNEKELHEILDRCSFRALKSDWSDLPEQIKIPMRLEMTDKQRRIYKEMLQDFYTMVAGHEFTAPMVLAQMDKLRQITSGLLIDGDKHTLIEESPKDNPKIRAALDLLETGPGKMIIVHFYRPIGHVILNVMKQEGYKPAYIRGQMEPHEVQQQKKMFNEDDECRVLVAQIKSASRAHTLLGGEGINRCSRMYFHDGTFSLLDREQMEDRIHRGAQDQVCLYYDPVMGPIDEAQLKALGKKLDLVSVVVDAVRALKP